MPKELTDEEKDLSNFHLQRIDENIVNLGSYDSLSKWITALGSSGLIILAIKSNYDSQVLVSIFSTYVIILICALTVQILLLKYRNLNFHLKHLLRGQSFLISQNPDHFKQQLIENGVNEVLTELMNGKFLNAAEQKRTKNYLSILNKYRKTMERLLVVSFGAFLLELAIINNCLL